jgi:outer membrane lipoprotein SlyB
MSVDCNSPKIGALVRLCCLDERVERFDLVPGWNGTCVLQCQGQHRSNERGSEMKSKAIGLVACVVSLAIAGQANAAGCMKGAAAGGVAGHFVGKGHAVAGAAGGCAVGHHMANKKAKENSAQAQNRQTQAQTSQ